MPDCPFCKPDPSLVLAEGKHSLVLRDAHPVSPGHALVVPKRHVGSWFSATKEEHAEMQELMFRAQRLIQKEHKPDGFNIGINDGVVAGQTIPHLHIHLIPRYKGDKPDPRGGIRWIFPDKADYWNKQ